MVVAQSRLMQPRKGVSAIGAMEPIKGLESYRHAILKAERVSRPAILRLFHFENRVEGADAFDNPVFEFVSRHVQNFVWTKQRFFAKLRRRRHSMVACASVEPLDGKAPRIFLDMTGTSRFYSFGGIARVANKLSDEAIESGAAIPVFIEDGKVFTAKRRDRKVVSFKRGDVYIILDTFWHPIEEYKSLISTLKGASVVVATFIHDVIPAQYPAFMGSAFPGYFTRSLFEIVERSDLLLSVSESAASEIGTFLAREAPSLATKPIKAIHLGSDSIVDNVGSVRQSFAALFDRGATFLTVGTICPHKGQFLALTGFDQLWARGSEVRLVLIGKAEPAFRGISRAIRQHDQFGKKLHWIDDASDAELAFAYRSATCLIQPSIAEGFGVPIIEARAAGLPVLASNIAVFREIGGTDIHYFDSCDSANLAEMAEVCATAHKTEPKTDMRTWKHTLEDVVAVVGTIERVER